MNGSFAPLTTPPGSNPQEQAPPAHVALHHPGQSGLTFPNGANAQVVLPEEIRPESEPESEPQGRRQKRR